MKTNILPPLFLLIISLAYLSSCSPVLYTNVGQNVPLLQEKGEAVLSAGYAETYDAEGFSGQFALAVDSSLAIISSLYVMKDIYKGDSDWSGKGSYFEVGIGKFKRNKISKLTGEIFLGTGFGSIKNKSGNQFVNATYIKPFIQPSGGFSSRYVDVVLTPRIGLVSYTGHNSNLSDINNQSSTDNYFNSKKSTIVFEPGATIRLGFENVKLQVQYTYSTFKYESDEMNPINPEFVSISLFCLISKRWATQD